ncbi:ATP-binding protein [Streptomyces sp. N2-109]|uniref:histidine kinase n=1 Tax=Streptomyces gossypii TaxID=2883101 RepID=A0ABT2JQ52_9ACTN|nr:ATP-binding protein [Streptomyces gossypii]MCT2590009.1 ATP-binding protein [Streptomyces gossypii]
MTSDASRSPDPVPAPTPTPTPTHAITGADGGPTGIGPRTALAALCALLVTAPACLLSVYAAPQSARAGIAWGSGAAGLALCAAVGFAAWQLLAGRRLRVLLAAQHAEADALRDGTLRFAEETVPALVTRLRGGASADTALAGLSPAPSDPAQRRVLGTLAAELHRSETARATAMAACATAAGRAQALTTSMAADLREMEHQHDDADVLGDLLRLDHRTAQTGRLADSIAVLAGARSERRWAKPIVMESILRGAMGRINDYRRVRLHSTCTAAVDGDSAEGVMHALAELLDNAATFSPPTAEVHVYVEEVSSGVVIAVEDGGLLMDEAALGRAQKAVNSGAVAPDTRSAARLGLTVVGLLARRHDLTVSYRPSAHGGTGVLLRIPQALITHPHPDTDTDTPTRAAAVREPRHPRHVQRMRDVQGILDVRGVEDLQDAPEVPVVPRGADEPQAEHGGAVRDEESGLPLRRSVRKPAAAQRPPATPPAAQPREARSPEESGARFAGFRRAGRERVDGPDGADGPDWQGGTPSTPSGPPASARPRPEEGAE